NWEIPLTVTATCNKNIDFCANYFNKTLKALSLSGQEVESYKALNKPVYKVNVFWVDPKLSSDSASASHIMISIENGDTAKALAVAESLLVAVRAGSDFSDL
ncbi:MAG: peptidylprolyl isomerase, partial [Flammeovirgaceae bacterium]